MCTSIMATEIGTSEGWPAEYVEDDTTVNVQVMRSCVFLSIRNSRTGAMQHVSMTREAWAMLATTPPQGVWPARCDNHV